MVNIPLVTWGFRYLNWCRTSSINRIFLWLEHVFNIITVVRSFFIFFHALLQTFYSIFRFCLSDFPTACAQNLTTRQRQAEVYVLNQLLGWKHILVEVTVTTTKNHLPKLQSCAVAIDYARRYVVQVWLLWGVQMVQHSGRWPQENKIGEWQALPFLNDWPSQTHQKHIWTNPKYATASQTGSLSQLL